MLNTNIDPVVQTTIAQLSSSLTNVVISGTVAQIQAKVSSLKNEKEVDKVRAAYDEMINQLIAEREAALMIAQSYRDECERITIDDDDISYLQETITKVLDILQVFGIMDEKNTEQIETINAAKQLLSIEVLKTMQLLGFNYKAAIGEPLTHLCARKINSLLPDNKALQNVKTGSKQKK